MSSQYIPENKRKEQPSLWYRITRSMFGSIYIGKMKITLDAVGGPMWKLGIQLTPRYKQFEINVGKIVLVFWIRETL